MTKAEMVRARTERFINDFLETIARAAGLGFVVIASTVIGVQAGHLFAKNACAAEHNLVEVPAYTATSKAEADSDEYPKPDLKYQYEPSDDEKPVLKKKAQQEEIAHGAKHMSADELVVDPDSDEFDTNDEPIIERLSDEEMKVETGIVVPSLAPTAPITKKSENPTPDIGRRTAEVR